MTSIPLHSARYPGLSAVIDDQDAELVAGYEWTVWYKGDVFYARARTPKHIWLCMHSLIRPDLRLVDHEDHDGLNNRRSNLRDGKNGVNQHNIRKCKRKTTSRYKGVHWNRASKSWLAQIRVNRKLIYLGVYGDEIEAAKAYNTAAVKHHGDSACLNEIPQNLP